MQNLSREKNNSVKPACHKMYQGIFRQGILFAYFLFLNIFCCNPLDVDQTLSVY